MQAIRESNEHLKSAIEAMARVKEADAETIAYHEANLALVKGYQAMAYALLAVADAVRISDNSGIKSNPEMDGAS